MAKFTSSVFTEIRGSIGGTTYSRNKSGAYTRQRTVPINPNTSAQQVVRNRLSTVSQTWQTLTQGQRDSFINGAVNFPYVDTIGVTQYYSGQQLFMKLNSTLLNIGQAQIATCPLPSIFETLTINTLTISVAGNNIDVTTTFGGGGSIVPVGFVAVVEATAQRSEGVKFFGRSDYKQIAISDAGVDLDATNYYTPYVAIFGNYVAGSLIGIRFVLVEKVVGQLSTASTLSDIVA